MSKKKQEGMSIEDMCKQLAMHKRALAALEWKIVNEHRYYPRKIMEGTIEYHKFRIENYKEMIKKGGWI